MWEKEKMLVTSIFSFSYNVFKGLPFEGRKKLGLCGKELSLFIIHKSEDYKFKIVKKNEPSFWMVKEIWEKKKGNASC